MNDKQPSKHGERIPAPGTMAYAQWKRRQELMTEPVNQETGEPAGQLDGQEVGQPARQEARKLASQKASQPSRKESGFELGAVGSVLVKKLKPLHQEEPTRKATFLVTADEAEILEELKLRLRRELKAKATKNDIVRAAIRLVGRDFAKNQKTSFLARKVAGK